MLAPPAVMLLSFASRNCTVTVVVLMPFATMLGFAAVIVERVPAIACTTLIGTFVEIPLDVARIVADPFASAVATPVTESIVTNVPPVGTDQRTCALGMGLPEAL